NRKLYSVMMPKKNIMRRCVMVEGPKYVDNSILELLWRLGVPQAFRRGFNIPWETQNGMVLIAPKAKYKPAGYVYRLFSGKANQELHKQKSTTLRAYNRLLAIQDFLDGIDERIARKSQGFDPNRLFLYDEKMLSSARLKYWSGDVKVTNIVNEILKLADEISSTVASWYETAKNLRDDTKTQVEFLDLKNGDNSKAFLNDNTDILEDKNDFVIEDVDKTSDFESEKLESDASVILSQVSIPSLFENITILTLAHHFSGNVNHSRWAANLIRTFLLSSYGIQEKIMDSQVPSNDYNHLDTINEEGYGFPYLNKIPRAIPKYKSALFRHSKDLFDVDPSSFLDSCRLLYRAKAITHKEYIEIRLLASCWLEILLNSPKGIEISINPDHRGTLYDLQVISLAGFLDDVRLYLRVTNRVRMRIAKHFYVDSDAPVASPMTQINEIIYVNNEIRQGRIQSDDFEDSVFKYSTLNLQYWILLTRINQNVGIGPDLWQYVSHDGKQLSRAIIGHLGKYSKNFENTTSLLPLLYITRTAFLHSGKKLGITYNCEEHKKMEYSPENFQQFMKNLDGKKGNTEKIKLMLLCEGDLIENDVNVDPRKTGLPPLWMLGVA
ncbi:6388_t:CDS:2, partial [Acaulospora morrowiae]